MTECWLPGDALPRGVAAQRVRGVAGGCAAVARSDANAQAAQCVGRGQGGAGRGGMPPPRAVWRMPRRRGAVADADAIGFRPRARPARHIEQIRRLPAQRARTRSSGVPTPIDPNTWQRWHFTPTSRRSATQFALRHRSRRAAAGLGRTGRPPSCTRCAAPRRHRARRAEGDLARAARVASYIGGLAAGRPCVVIATRSRCATSSGRLARANLRWLAFTLWPLGRTAEATRRRSSLRLLEDCGQPRSWRGHCSTWPAEHFAYDPTVADTRRAPSPWGYSRRVVCGARSALQRFRSDIGGISSRRLARNQEQQSSPN